jgi:alcohol dehydrogenase
MPMFLRKINHSLYLKLMKFFASMAPSLRHVVFSGTGSSAQLCDHIARTGVKKVLVVTDKPLRDLGVVDRAISNLIAANIDVAIYDGVQPDPTYVHVAEGAAAARKHGSEAVLAIGGGSSIDAAKVIIASATSDESPVDWVGFAKFKHEPLTLYAIPTTSGTGSEATIGAVISDSETHAKSIIAAATMLPAAAALDPELTAGLPPHITAATGMDALTHGIEAYIGVWDRGSRLEDSRIAIKLIFDLLPTAYRDGSNLDARAGVAMGAYYAGLAINQVNVGNVHAIAHQLGGKYGIPHGLANSLVLPHVLSFCVQEAEKPLAELAVLVGLGNHGENPSDLAHLFIKAVRDLRTEVGIPDNSDLLKREDFADITAAAMAEGAGYPVPRLLDEKSTLMILNEISV